MSNLGDLHHHRAMLNAQMKAKMKAQTPQRLPDFYMPAMPPLGLITAFENWMRRWIHRRRQWMRAWARRRRMLQLLDYDDHMLEDIGYTRQELLWAARLPIRVNARRAVLRRRRNPKAGDGF